MYTASINTYPVECDPYTWGGKFNGSLEETASEQQKLFFIKMGREGGKLSKLLQRSLDELIEERDGIRWGLCHVLRGNWQYIQRFETYIPKHR